MLKCLRMLTFLPLEQIDEMDQWEGSQLNQAKGDTGILSLQSWCTARKRQPRRRKAPGPCLAAGASTENMPTFELSEEDFTDGTIDILSILNKSGLAASRSEARRNVEQGGVSVDGNPVKDIQAVFSRE